MTEQEYINVRDLSTAMNIRKIISDIIPENSIVVKKEDFVTVYKILSQWEEQLFEIINTKND